MTYHATVVTKRANCSNYLLFTSFPLDTTGVTGVTLRKINSSSAYFKIIMPKVITRDKLSLYELLI